MRKLNANLILAVMMILVAALTRILNAQLHLPNYAPILAFGLFGGAILKNNRILALLIPVLAQLVADTYFSLFTNIPGFYNAYSMIFNYAGLATAAVIGMMIQIKPAQVVLGAIGAAVLFFFVSNFGFFAEGWNGYTLNGLVKTYADGIPFFKSSFEGNLVCSAVLFGGYAYFRSRTEKQAQKVRA